MGNDNIRYLTTVSDVIEYGIVEAKLKQHGIPILKRQDGYGACMSIFTGRSYTGIDVYVPELAYDDAVEIMKINWSSIEPGEYLKGEVEDEYLVEQADTDEPKKEKDYTGVIIVLIVIVLVMLVLKKSLGA